MKFVDYARAAGRYTGLGAALLSTPVNLDGHHLPQRGRDMTSIPLIPATPIKHVIVIIGENRSFDHVYATYKSPSGDFVSNLLSKGIINADGTPGPNFLNAATSERRSIPQPDLVSAEPDFEMASYAVTARPAN